MNAKQHDTKALQELDRQHYMHPFTDSKAMHEKGTRIITGADGCYIYDSEGGKVLDGMAGLWCVNVGYGRHELADVAAKQMRELPYYNSFFGTAHPPVIKLAAQLKKLAPKHISHVFFTGSGSESNDTNVRMVRHYWQAKGQPSKRIIISRDNAYHGSTIASASLGGFEFVHNQFETLPYVQHIADPNWYVSGGDLSEEEFGLQAARELEKRIDQLGEENVAAFIAEPIQGAGGVIVPPDSYWPEVRRILKDRDILFVSDEVICGFGRTGKLFGCETYGMEPDLLTFAKAVTNGFQPLGGVMVSEKVAEVITGDGGEFGHGFTYSGHPIACAAALATMDIMENGNFIQRVADDIGPYLQRQWTALGNHPIVGHVRGAGMLGSIELVRDKESRERLEPEQKSGGICREFCVANGLIMRAVGDSMIISPPFVSTHEEIDLLIARATKSLDQTAEHYSV